MQEEDIDLKNCLFMCSQRSWREGNLGRVSAKVYGMTHDVSDRGIIYRRERLCKQRGKIAQYPAGKKIWSRSFNDMTKRRDHITPVLAELHWLSITARIYLKIALITFKTRPTILATLSIYTVPAVAVTEFHQSQPTGLSSNDHWFCPAQLRVQRATHLKHSAC